MNWQEIREHYPHRWLLVEAVQAHSSEGRRILDEMAVLQAYPTARPAMQAYLEQHRRSPERELYVLHADREEPGIDERHWLGLRRAG